MGKITPLLKWAGGKRWLIPYIQPIWDENNNSRLVEPFCGGAAITLGLMPDSALLNDINPHLINLYNWVKKGQIRIDGFLNSSDAFYKNRAEFNNLTKSNQENSQRSAELFFYLNKTCFNGLCRFNQSGEFNVPFGSYNTINYDCVDFEIYKEIFSSWTFSNKSFEKLSLRDNDFVFADPPYDVDFRSYSKEGFSWEQQKELAYWLAEHSGPVLLCNRVTPRIEDLYNKLGYSLHYLNERILITANGDRPASKMLIATKNIKQKIE